MGLEKTRDRFRSSFFSEGIRADVKNYCDSRKECQITQKVKTKNSVPVAPVVKHEWPCQVEKADLIGSIEVLKSKGDKCALWIVDQHTRWGETISMTNLKDKVTCETSISIFLRAG
ncbi:hypothetical protein AVEN_26001-1 [Araneus ventricosus]|uniref:RNA-directed DNA polymerase n=1 Tax=Araneus ventricosus TaxID=182803 RepID=A0A4Y2E640_ARAVE|nr:hypothetical protein AVEN_26001-1 [Araneus ventricosus]